ncbi:MAG: 2-oxo-4-hydroxy-4-carboxy-5-ureidoimidazoline decarboxylase [Spirochaetaceae bacterium]|nr:MAG: 2-oxo-4-hydroxy-4-carboxy-5-ureidoimidazoline decarboxylase [Spirochaetaceae bacterium]
MSITVTQLNQTDRDTFVRLLGGIFEHSPWVAEAAFAQRPFRDVEHLHHAMCAAVSAAPPDQRLALIQAHPDLAGKAAVAGALTEASSREQSGAGLDRLSPEDFARFHALNNAYRSRFGFPFIIAVRGYTAAGILNEFERRLNNRVEDEEAEALTQIERIALFRVHDTVVHDARGNTTSPETQKRS